MKNIAPRSLFSVKRLITLIVILAVFFGDFVVVPSSASAMLQTTDASANGYVSLHQYISLTEIPNVFRVTQSAKARIDQPGTFIAFILDRSGSMNAKDILDVQASSPTTSVYIDRRVAVNRAIESTLNEFFVQNAAGQVDIHKIFVSIVSEDVSADAAHAVPAVWGSAGFAQTGKLTENAATSSSSGHIGSFVPLVDPLKASVAVPSYPTDLNPVLATALNNYATLPANMSFMDDAFKYTYQSLRDALLVAGGGTGIDHVWMNGIIPDNRLMAVNAQTASKYILVMGDGDPNGDLAIGQNYLFAAKTPAAYDSAGKLNSLATSAYGQSYGLGAVVWSSVFGADAGHNTIWRSDALQSNGQWLNDWSWRSGGLRSTYWYYSSQNSNYRIVEPFMILSAYTPKNVLSTTAFPSSLGSFASWGALPTINPTYTKGTYPISNTAYWTEADCFVNIYDLMVSDMNASSLPSDYDYYWVMHTGGDFSNIKMADTSSAGSLTNLERQSLGSNDAEKVFKNFALASIKSNNTRVSTILNTEMFQLYHFPGTPLLETTSDDTMSNQSATSTGTSSFQWDIGTMRDGYTYTLIFYIMIDENASIDKFYSYGTAIFSSDGNQIDFPTVFVSVSGETQDYGGNTNTNRSASESHDTNIDSSFGDLIPIVESTNAAPYTPSVTPRAIQSEGLEEKTKDVPVTSTKTNVMLFLFLGLGLCLISLAALRNKKKR